MMPKVLTKRVSCILCIVMYWLLQFPVSLCGCDLYEHNNWQGPLPCSSWSVKEAVSPASPSIIQ